jgi:hypothetical protein
MFKPLFLLAAISAIAAPAHADGMGPHPWKLELGGYGELGATFYNHGTDQNRPGGSLHDSRLELDATRFVAAVEGTMPGGFEFEAELEIEHGGTGAAKEVEFDEFGEIENEIEKGGEVQLEELYIKRSWGRYQAGVGRFYLALGHLHSHYRPTDYLGAQRSEAETTIFPGQWDEMGATFSVYFPRVVLTAQLVNGLDSSGFSSRAWVSAGHQGSFETIRATDLAGVLRVQLDLGHATLGLAGYVGGTNRNRPKADLVKECTDPEPNEVYPCGSISSTVAIGAVDARWHWKGIRGQALGVFGHLSNAAAISARNDRLSNELGVDRTPVSDKAIAIAGEVGYDVAPHLGLCEANALEPFVRFDYYDTMYDPRADLFDNPRYARMVLAAGVSYTYDRALVGKLELRRRSFGTDDLRLEHAVQATAGFVY